jgi:hypothetical protein
MNEKHMTQLRLLTVGSNHSLVDAVVTQVAHWGNVKTVMNEGATETLDKDVIRGVFAEEAASIDVIIAIGERARQDTGDIGPMARWLSSLDMHVWRILLVVVGSDRKPHDDATVNFLGCVEQNIGGQPILVHLVTRAHIQGSCGDALSFVLGQAMIARPPLNTPSRELPRARHSAWTVGMIVADPVVGFTTEQDMSSINWTFFPHVHSYRIGCVIQTDPDAPRSDRGEPTQWTDNPTALSYPEDIPECMVTLAIANVAVDGTIPEHFKDQLTSHVHQYPSMVLCLKLPGDMSLRALNLVLAEQWQQQLTSQARPCVRVYGLQSQPFLGVWHALTRVNPVVVPQYDPFEADLMLMLED